MSYIQNKIISNKNDKNSSEFVVLSSEDYTNTDWISTNKFEQINEKGLIIKPTSYVLRDFKESNVDEGISGVEGKALSAAIKDTNVIIKIYVMKVKDAWVSTREYVIDKSIYDAYVLCIKNDIKVIDLEKKAKNAKKFDLELA